MLLPVSLLIQKSYHIETNTAKSHLNKTQDKETHNISDCYFKSVLLFWYLNHKILLFMFIDNTFGMIDGALQEYLQ